MATKLTKPITREIEIDGEPHTVVLSEKGIRITRKRMRHGVEHAWSDLTAFKPEKV